MSTITITPQPVEAPDIEAPAVFPWPLYRMSLEQYDALVESGLFTERDRLQLINGILVTKVTQGDDHCVADEDCRTALQRALPPGWFIRSNKPVDIPPDGVPEPDQAVVRGSNRDYGRKKRGRPGAKDVALIVEIAQSRLPEDRAMVRNGTNEWPRRRMQRGSASGSTGPEPGRAAPISRAGAPRQGQASPRAGRDKTPRRS
jgi:Uma2 family endonuclease